MPSFQKNVQYRPIKDIDFTSARAKKGKLIMWSCDSDTAAVKIHQDIPLAMPWRSVKSLGSLLGDSQDVSRRKQLAAAAYRTLMTVWCRRLLISEKRRLRLYNAFVLPVLTHNCGTWGSLITWWQPICSSLVPSTQADVRSVCVATPSCSATGSLTSSSQSHSEVALSVNWVSSAWNVLVSLALCALLLSHLSATLLSSSLRVAKI